MTDFGPLFDYVPPAPSSPKPTEQERQLERVTSRLECVIVEFCKARVGQEFFAAELRSFVQDRVPFVAPGSPDRVLRQLRQKNVIAYRVTSRKDSRYLIEGA